MSRPALPGFEGMGDPATMEQHVGFMHLGRDPGARHAAARPGAGLDDGRECRVDACLVAALAIDRARLREIRNSSGRGSRGVRAPTRGWAVRPSTTERRRGDTRGSATRGSARRPPRGVRWVPRARATSAAMTSADQSSAARRSRTSAPSLAGMSSRRKGRCVAASRRPSRWAARSRRSHSPIAASSERRRPRASTRPASE